MILTPEKIASRQLSLNNSIKPSSKSDIYNYNVIRLFDESNNFFANNALEKIYHWESLNENKDIAYGIALDTLALMVEHCANGSMITTARDFLFSEANKVRNATQMKNSLKYRFSKMRKLHNAVDMEKNTPSKAQQTATNIKNSNPISANGKRGAGIDKDQIASEMVRMFEQEFRAIHEADRIMTHYAKIHDRFNIDWVLAECADGKRDLYDTIYTIAQRVDTYNTPFKNRFNAALETAWYGLNSRSIPCTNEFILNTVADYYIFTGGLSESNRKDIFSLKKISPVFEEYDFTILGYLDDIPDETISRDDVNYFDKIDHTTVERMEDMEESAIERIMNIKRSKDPSLRENINELLTSFRKNCAVVNSSSLMNFKGIVSEMEKYPEEVVYALPQVLSIVRMGFIVSGAKDSINEVCKIITRLVKSTENIPLNPEQCKSVLNALKHEQDLIKNKLDKIPDIDTDTSARFTTYSNCISSLIDELIEYSSANFEDSEDESSEESPDEENVPEGETSESDLKEAAKISLISNLLESVAEVVVDTGIDEIIHGNIAKYSPDMIDSIVDFANTAPNIINKDKLRESIMSHRNKLRESGSLPSIVRIDVLNDEIDKLNEARHYESNPSLNTSIAYLMCLDELVRTDLNHKSRYFNEGMSFVNTLKLAVNNLRRKAVDLSEKEKSASEAIDGTINQMMRSMDKEMSAARREQIARGSILPSASKCIKLALVFAAAWIIQPELAVIGAIGAFFMNARATHAERQLALDEIEVELKMCERYINKYEQENNLQAVRQCEIIQRNLRRQYQRIKYRMKIDFRHADTSSVANTPGIKEGYYELT